MREMLRRKIKVLHFIPSFGPGGAERLLLDILENIDRNIFQPLAVSLYPPQGNPYEREIVEKKLPVIFLTKHRGPDPKTLLNIHRVIRLFKPDVVHTHLYTLHYTILPVLLNRIPVRIHTVHCRVRYEVPWYEKVIHWVAFRYGKVLPVSVAKAIDAEISTLYGKKLRTKVIYNGINPAKFAHIRTLYPTIGENSLILLHIGSFSPVKNHELLIEAFSRVEKQIPKIYLWLVGDGAERPKIEELVKDKQIIEKVRFLGIRDDIPNLLAQADIFVLCSNSEAFPVAILEAMASGLPVVATAVGGVPEAVINGKTGILVPPNNPEALADAIFQLSSNAALRQQMGMNARQRVAGLFDVKRITREYERLYIEELNRRLKERNHVKTAKSIIEEKDMET